jgi:3-hydroxybutyrate dehydrogenase
MLKGKTALVTGSTSGIGLGIARALATEGANVVLNGFGDAREIEALRSGLAKDAGVTVTYSTADMTKPDDIAKMVAEAEAKFGAVDILVNNAGIQHVAPIEDFPINKWNAIIAINLSTAFHATKAVLGEMKQRKSGGIINIASAHGLVASGGKAAYVAARHGLVCLTKVVAIETVNDRVGAWIGRWLRLLARLAYQWTRAEAGMPSLAIRLSTLHPIFASVF